MRSVALRLCCRLGSNEVVEASCDTNSCIEEKGHCEQLQNRLRMRIEEVRELSVCLELSVEFI